MVAVLFFCFTRKKEKKVAILSCKDFVGEHVDLYFQFISLEKLTGAKTNIYTIAEGGRF